MFPISWRCPNCSGLGSLCDGSLSIGPGSEIDFKPATTCYLCLGRMVVICLPVPPFCTLSPDATSDLLNDLLLSRRALEVTLKRGWTAYYAIVDKKAYLEADDQGAGGVDTMDWHPGPFKLWLESRTWDDPRKALVEANDWYEKNIEAANSAKSAEV